MKSQIDEKRFVKNNEGKRICLNCGVPEDEHCNEFIPMELPIGCICDPYDWASVLNIPVVCDNYIEDEETKTCKTCEHLEECHIRG